MNTFAKRLIACLFLLALPVAALGQPQQKFLAIGLIPEMNVFAQMDRFDPLAKYLTEKTGLEVRFTILSRYGNIIESFSSEKMDGAFFGSFTGAMAIEKLGVVPLARPVNLDGKSTYHAHIYVRKDSGIKSVAEMKGKRFAFVEKATTAGYIFPLAYLKEQGVFDIDTFFSEYFFAGSHDASLNAVLNGHADIGASKNTVFDWVRKSDPRVDKEIAILAESARVPSNGLCVRKSLDPQIQRRLKEALLELHRSPEGQRVLAKFNAIKFIETGVDDYRRVFEFAAKANIDLRQYVYRND